MVSKRGFTVVELMIAIAIMVILTSLVIVRLTSSQVNSRDYERKTDIEAISKGLETYYMNGDTRNNIPKGYYPGSVQVQAASTTSPPYGGFLEGVSNASFISPGKTITNSFGFNSSATASGRDGSYTDAQARSLLSTYPYLYQPLRRNNTFCTSYVDCVKYNLYYITEADDKLHIVRSKNQ